MGKLVDLNPLLIGEYNEIASKVKELGVEEATRQLPYSETKVLYVAHNEFDHPYPPTCELREPVKDVTDIDVVVAYEDDHLPCLRMFFRDEQGRLRYAELRWNRLGPGMIRYSQVCEEAKQELIEAINEYYKMLED